MIIHFVYVHVRSQACMFPPSRCAICFFCPQVNVVLRLVGCHTIFNVLRSVRVRVCARVLVFHQLVTSLRVLEMPDLNRWIHSSTQTPQNVNQRSLHLSIYSADPAAMVRVWGCLHVESILVT